MAIVGTRRKQVIVWDLIKGEVVRLLDHDDYVRGVTFSPDGKTALTASGDHNVRMWDIETGEIIRVIDHGNSAWSVDFSPDGKWVYNGAFKEA